MGITGLIPFLEKASRRANISEFSGCTVAIDTYCWLHKGAFACADKLVRGEATDIYVKYCMKYVNMLLSKNIKPIMVFDGRHLPAKACTEEKRRESRDTSKKRAAELLSLGKTDEAQSYLRRCVDVTPGMALSLIRACRARRVDCLVAPHEADAQLAFLNIHNYAQLVITEDSDLVLFGCTKVLFKMDLSGCGTLVDGAKLPLTMRVPPERYDFATFRRMCVLAGCDYLPSLPGVGLAKARQFVVATKDADFSNALKKLPMFLNKPALVVDEEYRAGFLRAEATLRHQFVFDPSARTMTRLTEPDDEEWESLCVDAGSRLPDATALQLAWGNLEPNSLRELDNWHPNHMQLKTKSNSSSWSEPVAPHPSIWEPGYEVYLKEERPWLKKKKEPITLAIRGKARNKVVTLEAKYVAETQDQSLTIESLSKMYCAEPANKKQRIGNETQLDSQEIIPKHELALNEEQIQEQMNSQEKISPILENKQRSFKKSLQRSSSYSVLKRLSKFPRTTIDESNVVQSKFFSSGTNAPIADDAPSIPDEKNPFKSDKCEGKRNVPQETDSQCSVILDTQEMELSNSQKENSPMNSPVKTKHSPVLDKSFNSKNPFRISLDNKTRSTPDLSPDSIIDNTYPLEILVTPVDSQASFGSETKSVEWRSPFEIPSKSASQPIRAQNGVRKSNCRVPGLKRTGSLPSNQPTLLNMFGFQKKAVMKR